MLAGTRRRLSRVAMALIAIGAVVALVLGAAVGAVLLFEHSLDRNIERIHVPFETLSEWPEPAPEPGSNAPVNFLVLGSDPRISAATRTSGNSC